VAIAVVLASALQLVVMGRAVTPLVIALVVSYILWIGQGVRRPTRGLLAAYAAALIVQCLHLVEEYRTGFYRVFPPVFGAEPWSPGRFLVFNFTWLAAFLIAGIGIAYVRRSAYVVALFLAIGGGIGNGLGHLALAVRRGGYFPGTYTAVLALFVGSILLRKLLRTTESSAVAT
jgi:hypothetical protein